MEFLAESWTNPGGVPEGILEGISERSFLERTSGGIPEEIAVRIPEGTPGVILEKKILEEPKKEL